MILLVEDNQDDAALIVSEMEKHTAAEGIRHVTSGEAAVDFLQQGGGDALDLVLLNMQLPAPMTGLDVLKRLRQAESTRHVPVVMLSGDNSLDRVAQSYDLGANSVIRKDDRGAGFSETIGQLVPYWLELNHPYIRPGVPR